MPLITQAEFARQQGFSRAYVSKLAKQGKITLVQGKIDPKAVLAQLATHADPARQTHSAQGLDYAKAKTMNEAYKARLAKIRYEEKSEQLIDVQQVCDENFRIARLIRDSLLAIPERVSAVLAATDDEAEVKTILTQDIEQALLHLSDHRISPL